MIVAATTHNSRRTNAIDDMASRNGRSTSVFTSPFDIVFRPAGTLDGAPGEQERRRQRLAADGHRLGVGQGDVHHRQAGVEALTRDRADHPELGAAHRERVAEAGNVQRLVDDRFSRTSEVDPISGPRRTEAARLDPHDDDVGKDAGVGDGLPQHHHR